MKYTYDIQIRMDLGLTIPSVGKIVSNINDIYSNISGNDSKLILMSGPITLKMATSKELSDEELLTVKGLIIDTANSNSKKIMIDSVILNNIK